ncbi:ABC transporter permease [Mycolicibacterium thermoresistibile]|jgi:phospholipid/cholesterol/gamma-HCH transport system permease protein|uniref:ABC-type transport system n=1 Tax=Mycolicibacterium thermoresistibile TaxID=1797 RepID=A0A100XGH0_MYCTH|nr:ABC transporter permease [Mycolicibacterium thermoresistibile]MCV7190804.1 ABC transporter permease [Mycolicibacterium thermoresistibile]GAT16219.1 ABC-type transport system [Mycolicibacterium thermoresistibile]SNW18643.1 ABC-type transport system involved in resistance to organic solvents, permease component [Mycolicibacterium thermoresistibile]HLT11022.1 ABC transporter permease [Micromonosporaceae bacterium]
MNVTTVATQHFPRLVKIRRRARSSWRRIGEQTRFYGTTIVSLFDACVYYRAELLRQVAAMSLGTGALAAIGGTVAVVAFLTMSTGGLIAAQGYNQFSQVGVDALVGFASAFLNTRLITPTTAAIALAATIGAGATAQLGAMRVNEEIDALEVMGVRSIAYLASTRLVAGVVVVLPLYSVALILAYFAARFGTTAIYGQSSGVYNHYFNTFLVPADVIRSFTVTTVAAATVMLIHTYYGYTASGGPAGVGEAVGRATRTSLVATALLILFVSLAIYGQTGQFNFSG